MTKNLKIGAALSYYPSKLRAATEYLARIDESPMHATVAYIDLATGKVNLHVVDHAGDSACISDVPVLGPTDAQPADKCYAIDPTAQTWEQLTATCKVNATISNELLMANTFGADLQRPTFGKAGQAVDKGVGLGKLVDHFGKRSQVQLTDPRLIAEQPLGLEVPTGGQISELRQLVSEMVETISYHHFPGTSVVTCLLVLKNGYTVLGSSEMAPTDEKAPFDLELAKRIALQDATERAADVAAFWKLERDYRADMNAPATAQTDTEAEPRSLPPLSVFVVALADAL